MTLIRPILLSLLVLSLAAAELTAEGLKAEVDAMKKELTGMTVEKAMVFVPRYLMSKEFEQMLKQEDFLERIAKNFINEKKNELLLKELEGIDYTKAEINTAKGLITVPSTTGGRATLTFKLEKGKWSMGE